MMRSYGQSQFKTRAPTVRALTGGLIAALLCSATGCNQNPPTTTAPSAPSTTTKPALTVLPEGYAGWTHDEAAEKLADATSAKGAALRLLSLAGATPMCVPATLTDLTLTRLRVVYLGDRYAVGVMDLADDARLHAPVFISKGGLVTQPISGLEEELATLHISKDPELFPHLITTPRRVILLDDVSKDAIIVRYPSAVAFRLGKRGEFSYVSLVYLGGESPRSEIGRYQWDAFSLMFQGPGCDKLPEPPGGLYELDIKASHRLNPVGGTFPDAKPIPNTPPPNRQRPGEPPPELGEDGYDA